MNVSVCLQKAKKKCRSALNMYRRERLEKERVMAELEKVQYSNTAKLPSSLFIKKKQLKDSPHTRGILGSGSFGECLLQTFRGMVVSVKQFKHLDLHKRRVRYEVVKEAKVLLNLNASQHVPYLIGISVEDPPFVLVTSFHGISFKSSTLHSVMSRKTDIRCNPIDWIVVVKQICVGLGDIHNSGYLHNDLKTDNILIEYEGSGVNIVIIDFGKSCLIRKATRKVISIEERQSYRKRYPWVANEIIDGSATFSIASDIYSLGYVVNMIQKFGHLNTTRFLNICEQCMSNTVSSRPSLPRVIDLISGIV
ncbi:uncharacterized protein LOC135503561 [Lineus longissimus]|uniref:uncharacterized protein LOC135503561 n=1 Tax=Lineus longissimus TaxID=88925 RepID=UPI00315D970C